MAEMEFEVTESKRVGEGTPVQSERTVTIRTKGFETGSDKTLSAMRKAAQEDLEAWAIDRRVEMYGNLRRNSIMMILQATAEGQDTRKYLDLILRHPGGLSEEELAMIEKEYQLSSDLGKMKDEDQKGQQANENTWPGQREPQREPGTRRWRKE